MPRNLYNRVELVTPIERRRGARRADRRARPLAGRQHELLGAGRGRRLDAAPARRRAARRPARADRAHTGARPRAQRSSARGLASQRDSSMAATPYRPRLLARGGRAERSRRPRCEGEQAADVVVVGGGYTGLWTAWHLKRLEPEARIVVLEADCLRRGPERAQRRLLSTRSGSACRRCADASATAAAIATSRGRRRQLGRRGRPLLRRAGGRRLVSPRRLHAGLDGAGLGRRLGAGAATPAASSAIADACRPLDRERRFAPRCASPIFRGGAFYPGAATVQPARLARGLRERVIERRGRGLRAQPGRLGDPARRRSWSPRASGGAVRAGRRGDRHAAAPLAGLPRMRRRLTLTSSHMVITEPVPELLEEIGWTGGECITDSRAMIHYFRTTPDGRIAFGWGGGRVVYGARTGGRAEVDPAVAARGRARPASASSRGSRAGGSSTPGAGRSTSRRPTCR